MKRSIVFFTTLLFGLYILLSSNSVGPASFGNGIRNDGPGSTGTCGSCHGGGSGITTLAITLKEKATNTPVAGAYKPGVDYVVTLTGNNPNLSLFGFQVTVFNGANHQAGAFGNAGTGKHVAMVSSIQVVEHSSSLPKTSGSYETEFDWTAPPAGTGTVTFHGILNAVNGDNNTSGDRVSDPVTLALTEKTATAIGTINQEMDFRIYPNPATDVLQIVSKEAGTGSFSVCIYDITGRLVQQETHQKETPATSMAIPVRSLPAGTYLLKISDQQQVAVRSFIKQ